MDKKCSMHGKDEKYLKLRDQLWDLDGRIILTLILKVHDARV
jgi:hypothetical protein